MAVQDAIGSNGFKTGDYTVTRTAASTDDGHGRDVPGATSTFSIAASVQPYSGKVLKVLPEGIHSEDVRHVFTAAMLTSRPRPDSIVIGDEGRFEVFAVEGPWRAFGGVHYVAHIAYQEPVA